MPQYYIECEGPNCSKPMWMAKIKGADGSPCWHPFDWKTVEEQPPRKFEFLTLAEIVEQYPHWVSHFDTCVDAESFRQKREQSEAKKAAKEAIKKQQCSLF